MRAVRFCLRATKYYLVLIALNISTRVIYLFWDWQFKRKVFLHGDLHDWLNPRANRFTDFLYMVHSSGIKEVFSSSENKAIPCYGPLTYVIFEPINKLQIYLSEDSMIYIWMIKTIRK